MRISESFYYEQKSKRKDTDFVGFSKASLTFLKTGTEFKFVNKNIQKEIPQFSNTLQLVQFENNLKFII